ncbi:hypothetical protein L0F63_005800 [Massospora cicadina]|nr:hypothetical protein L0F63_005800 [Massospora cicadina]
MYVILDHLGCWVTLALLEYLEITESLVMMDFLADVIPLDPLGHWDPLALQDLELNSLGMECLSSLKFL